MGATLLERSTDDARDDTTTGRWATAERLAPVAFGLLVAFAVPYVLLGVGAYHWFLRDDWAFIVSRDASLDSLFEAHNTHWSTIPILAFRALWALVGLHSYVPYQATVLALHLAICVLLRVVMRRAGVSPWLATVGAGAFVLFGPGAQNIVWAFQIGFTAAVAFGLLQFVLLDHDGPVDRRDAAALGAGLLSLMSAGVGVAMVAGAGVAALGRRGWRVAALHTAPLAAVFLGWYAFVGDPVSSRFGQPSVSTALRWVWETMVGTFLGLGVAAPLAIALVGVAVVGAALVWRREGRADPTAALGRLSLPVGLLVASLVFCGLTASGRWYLGYDAARASRYVHVVGALVLPLIVVGADAIARRWRAGLPAMLALLAVTIPFNATDFEPRVFGEPYMENEERLFTNLPRMPEATQVPRDVRPVTDPLYFGLDIGFLLDAVEDGKLDPSSEELNPFFANQLRLRLGLAQRDGRLPIDCERVDAPFDVSPAKGTVIGVEVDLDVRTTNGNRPTSPPVRFLANRGNTLTVELDGLDLRLAPARGPQSFLYCSTPP